MHRSSLTLAVLLIGIFLAIVAGADESDLPLQITSSAANMTEAFADCQANLLPWERPEASPAAATTGWMCGCGATFCVGLNIGEPCYGEESYCRSFGRVCSSDPSTWACTCEITTFP